MNFDTYLEKAWSNHNAETQKVAADFPTALSLITNSEQIAEMVALVGHVSGVHLGAWDSGIGFLNQLRKHTFCETGSAGELAVRRSEAALQISSGAKVNLESFSIGEQVKIFATAAGYLAERDTLRAEEFLRQALELAEGLEQDRQAYRSLAVTGHNLACTMEEKKNLRTEEQELMILAAKTSRKYWELAGTWLEVERAEYRLANTYLKADDLASALIHCHICLDICERQKAPALEFFFGHEILALVQKAAGNEAGYIYNLKKMKNYFEKLAPEDKSWCQKTLEKFN